MPRRSTCSELGGEHVESLAAVCLAPGARHHGTPQTLMGGVDTVEPPSRCRLAPRNGHVMQPARVERFEDGSNQPQVVRSDHPEVVSEVCADEVNVRVGNRVREEVPGLSRVEYPLAPVGRVLPRCRTQEGAPSGLGACDRAQWQTTKPSSRAPLFVTCVDGLSGLPQAIRVVGSAHVRNDREKAVQSAGEG
jgi:hypothetical protein